MKANRTIIKIDESKCNGCGLCVSACAEGAIQIIDGKARLVSDSYCDGLGACLGHCPQEALTIETRPAEAFDEEAVQRAQNATKKPPVAPVGCPSTRGAGHGCPGAMSRSVRRSEATHQTSSDNAGTGEEPTLSNWPVQLSLAPAHAPYFENARLLLAADCVPTALAGFHRRFLSGRILLICCPKLDDVEAHVDKLARILSQNTIRELEILHMEVPCCFGLVRLVEQAVEASGKDIPVRSVIVGIDGTIHETSVLARTHGTR